MPRLAFTAMPSWPPLAWLARCESADEGIRVFHGRGVETADEWFCEAAWDGTFRHGDFDTTDIVAGTGGRVRGTAVKFVASGSTVDRLHSFVDGTGAVWVSNSLACLLKGVGAELLTTHWYVPTFQTIIGGLRAYARELPTTRGPVRLTYFDNLTWRGGILTVERKPHPDRSFKDFSAYRDFLQQSMIGICENAAAPGRAHPMEPLGTLSSGYDSTTIASLAAQAGLKEVLTFTMAYTPDTPREAIEEDDGSRAAAVLGLQVRVLESGDWQAERLAEVPFIAGSPAGEDVHFTAAAPYLANRLLLTGYHGDTAWSMYPHDVSPYVVRGSITGLSLTEFRLWTRFLHCVVPFWGVRALRDIARISTSTEMKPWDTGAGYSRPICRRIAEEAGVPRDAFGWRKRATAVFPMWRGGFMSEPSRRDYLGWLREHRGEWLRERRLPPMPSTTVDAVVMETVRAVERGVERATWSIASRTGWKRLPVYAPIRRIYKLTYPDGATAPWTTSLRRYVFNWAVARAQARYESPVTSSS